MTPEKKAEAEAAYQEALRRIREAEKTGAVELDLSGWKEGETGVLFYTKLETLTRLPPELERLTWLRDLDLFGCAQLSGNLSPLATLTSLQSLNLSWCIRLSGDMTPLASLTSLQSLALEGCKQLSDLSPLASLTSLQSLNLKGCCQLSGDLSPLATLTSLQSLNLKGCEKLTGDLSALAGLTSLQSLNLKGCEKLTGDLSPLTGLASLQSLELSDCSQLIGDLSPLASLTSLQRLYLDSCARIRFAPLESLLPTLEHLSLFGCKLNDLPSEVCGERVYENVPTTVSGGPTRPQKPLLPNRSAHRPRFSFLTPGEISHPMPLKKTANVRKS